MQGCRPSVFLFLFHIHEAANPCFICFCVGIFSSIHAVQEGAKSTAAAFPFSLEIHPASISSNRSRRLINLSRSDPPSMRVHEGISTRESRWCHFIFILPLFKGGMTFFYSYFQGRYLHIIPCMAPSWITNESYMGER